MLKKKILLLFFFYTILFFIIYYASIHFYLKEEFFFDKNDYSEKYSYYKLDSMEIYGIPFQDKLTYIQIQFSLAYHYQDYKIEKDIILKKNDIHKFLHAYLSNKSYYQLDKAYKREKVKGEMIKEINKILKNPIIDIYYSTFWVMLIKN